VSGYKPSLGEVTGVRISQVVEPQQMMSLPPKRLKMMIDKEGMD